VSYRIDKGANIHAAIGKAAFDSEKLTVNAKTLIDSVVKGRPAAAKGEYVKSIHVATAMSPSLTLSKSVTK
jgi:large subunit ribosomal protein L1